MIDKTKTDNTNLNRKDEFKEQSTIDIRRNINTTIIQDVSLNHLDNYKKENIDKIIKPIFTGYLSKSIIDGDTITLKFFNKREMYNFSISYDYKIKKKCINEWELPEYIALDIIYILKSHFKLSEKLIQITITKEI